MITGLLLLKRTSNSCNVIQIQTESVIAVAVSSRGK